MKSVRRILGNDRSAMSEVVGTLLILAITVALFAVIIVWVTSFSGPPTGIRLDLDANLVPQYDAVGNPAGMNITVVHRGGESLDDVATRVYLTLERNGALSTEILRLQGTIQWGPNTGDLYGLLDGTNSVWNINERWSITNKTLLPTDRILVSVIDIERSVVVWSEQVLGPAGTHPPIFGLRWADGTTTTTTIDTPETGKTFGLYARLYDADNDLVSVDAELTIYFGTGSPCATRLTMYDDGQGGDAVAGDGVWTLAHGCLMPSLSWDGSLILFRAIDTQNHTTNSRMVLKVLKGTTTFNPFGGTWNSTLGGIGQGASGPYGDYGYNIYNASGLPTGDNPAGTPTRVFRSGEIVYVIARTTTVKNLENINSFILYDRFGTKVSPQTKEFDSRDPTKQTPAFIQTATSPYFEYQYFFDTTGLANAPYPLEFILKDNAGNAPFFTTDQIWVSADGQTTSPYPKIVTYRDPNNDGVLSDLTLETRFTSIEKIYVRIFFQDKDGTATYVNANAGDIEIQDYFGFYQVKKRPCANQPTCTQSNPPLSLISLFGFDPPTEKSYVVNIDLLRRDQDPFVPGTNWYTLRIRSIADQGSPGTVERYQMLATQIVIEAPLSVIDTVMSTEAGGKEDRGVYWYENNFYWREHPIDLLPKDARKPLAMATGDLNGDTKVDVVIGLDSKENKNIVAYFNLDYGTTWRRDFINQYLQQDKWRAESLAIGDLDGDSDSDLVAGIRDENGQGFGVIIFWNDGVWSTQVLAYGEGGNIPNQRSLAIGDMNNDGRPDIVAGDTAGKVKYYRNNVRGAFPTGVAGNYPPGDPNSFGAGVRLTTDTNSAIGYNSLRLAKMEGVSADLNPLSPGADTTLDVVAGAGTSVLIYRTSIGAGGSVSWTRYTLSASGDWPLAGPIQSLGLGDMNLDGRVDIVVGIDAPARTSGIYRLRNMGMTSGGTPTFNTWSSARLPHTTTNPTGQVVDLGPIKDLVVGDSDGDGDMDIVFISEKLDPSETLNNLWLLENIGDVPSSYVEVNVFTDGWTTRKEKAFAVEMAYINL